MEYDPNINKVLEALDVARKQAEVSMNNLSDIIKIGKNMADQYDPHVALVESLSDEHIRKALKKDFNSVDEMNNYVEQAKKSLFNFTPIIHQGVADKMLDGAFGVLPMGLNINGDKLVLKHLATTVLKHIEAVDMDNRESVILCSQKIRVLFLTFCKYVSSDIWQNRVDLYETFGTEHKNYTKMVFLIANSFIMNLDDKGFRMVSNETGYNIWLDFINGMSFQSNFE